MNPTTLYFDSFDAAEIVYHASRDRPDVTACIPVKVHSLDDKTGEIVEKWAIALTHWPLD